MKRIWGKRSTGKSDFPKTEPNEGTKAGRRKILPPPDIRHYFVPLSVLESTSKFFKNFEHRKAEGSVWWTGYVSGEKMAQVCTVIAPDIKTSSGLVVLNRDILSVMHKTLIELDQVLLIALHTHPPGAEGQSQIDAENPAACYPGFISIVVPNFGKGFCDLTNCHVYSYLADCQWRKYSRDEIRRKFVIERTIVEVNENGRSDRKDQI